MAPDLDLFVHASEDPILSWWLHRQFTHSLLFIPAGGLIVALILWIFYRRRYGFGWIYLAAAVGFATHGLLDAFTSYGTVLYWPFSSERIFWDILPIVDPVVTLFLLAGFLGSLWRRSAIPALVALLCVGAYTSLAYHQHHRGLGAQRYLAQSRGHELQHGRVMPTVGNILVWRSIYEDSGRIYADGLRLSLGGEEIVWEGGSEEKFQREKLSHVIPSGSVLDRDLNRLQWFADDYLIWGDRELG
jgi:inner membrane protein